MYSQILGRVYTIMAEDEIEAIQAIYCGPDEFELVQKGNVPYYDYVRINTFES